MGQFPNIRDRTKTKNVQKVLSEKRQKWSKQLMRCSQEETEFSKKTFNQAFDVPGGHVKSFFRELSFRFLVSSLLNID